tara:strand:- start:587 stop:1642 length:1056 start_codon:yes stop_codon:yes gene_type:complete
MVQNDVSLNHQEEKLVEMSNGCICCTLREDLLIEVTKLAKERSFDYLLIESTGISEPLPVAETFTFADEDGNSLSDVAKLDTMVTVVDAVNFLKDYDEAKYLEEVGESLGEDDQRSVADLLVDQVEFADILLISKTDLVTESDISKLKAILRTLNTHARIIPISNGEITTDEILSTDLFDFDRAQEAPGWLKELRGEHIPETEEYGISSFVYQARKPFYPQKFYDFLHSEDLSGKLIRSKGFFWLATRPQCAGNWSQAGGIAHHGFAGMFWKAIPKSHWPEDQESLDFINECWVEPFGDMRQELVFIGQELDKNKITQLLDDCLLSDSDMLLGKDHWAQLPDPFPEWQASA